MPAGHPVVCIDAFEIHLSVWNTKYSNNSSWPAKQKCTFSDVDSIDPDQTAAGQSDQGLLCPHSQL